MKVEKGMKKLILSLLMLLSFNAVTAKKKDSCTYWTSLFKPFCYRLHRIGTEGNTELYISGSGITVLSIIEKNYTKKSTMKMRGVAD